jgi:2-polyprenyl-3-methyl-5-hydroxy-6-metoxy-1,4-benzoquinol methylase
MENISDIERKIQNKRLLHLSARDIPPYCDKDRIYGEILKLVINPNKGFSERLKRYIDLKGKLIIELGSGSGFDSIDMTEEGAIVMGMELSDGRIEYNLELMKEKGLNYGLVKGDVCHLPFKNSIADVVICKHLIEHVSDPKARIKEFIGLLKEGGILYINFPNRYSIKQIFSDEHYKLPFIVLLPRFIADFIVTKIFRYEKRYSTNVFLSPYLFEKTIKKLNSKYTYVYPDMQLLKNKLDHPQTISNRRLKRIFCIFKQLRLTKLLKLLLDNRLFRNVLFPNFTVIVHRQS